MRKRLEKILGSSDRGHNFEAMVREAELELVLVEPSAEDVEGNVGTRYPFPFPWIAEFLRID